MFKPSTDLLNEFAPFDAEEAQNVAASIALLDNKGPASFSRENLDQHFTASTWVVNRDISKVLLLHHVKLDIWCKPGGHCDGDENIGRAALSELTEETGFEEKNIEWLTDGIFGVDRNIIPATQGRRGFEPEHTHYDITFAVKVDENQRVLIDPRQSHAFKWAGIDELAMHSNGSYVARFVAKIAQIKEMQTQVREQRPDLSQDTPGTGNGPVLG